MLLTNFDLAGFEVCGDSGMTVSFAFSLEDFFLVDDFRATVGDEFPAVDCTALLDGTGAWGEVDAIGREEPPWGIVGGKTGVTTEGGLIALAVADPVGVSVAVFVFLLRVSPDLAFFDGLAEAGSSASSAGCFRFFLFPIEAAGPSAISTSDSSPDDASAPMLPMEPVGTPIGWKRAFKPSG